MSNLTKNQKSLFESLGGRQIINKNLESREEVEKVLDVGGRNITFPKYESIVEYADEWLSPKDAKRFNLHESKREVINLVIAIRNRIAHQSPNSKGNMTKALKARHLISGLRRGEGGENNTTKEVRNPGVYLQARAESPNSSEHRQARLLIILSQLKEIGNDLCPNDLSNTPRRGHSRRKRTRDR